MENNWKNKLKKYKFAALKEVIIDESH